MRRGIVVGFVMVAACTEGLPAAEAVIDAKPLAIDAPRIRMGGECTSPNVCTCGVAETCLYDCMPGTSCDMRCAHVSDCDTACTGNDACTVDCEAAKHCVVDCNNNCAVKCSHEGCTVVDCPEGTCSVTCNDNVTPTRVGTVVTCG